MFWDMQTQTETLIPFENEYGYYQYLASNRIGDSKIYLQRVNEVAVLDLETQERKIIADNFQLGWIDQVVWSH